MKNQQKNTNNQKTYDLILNFHYLQRKVELNGKSISLKKSKQIKDFGATEFNWGNGLKDMGTYQLSLGILSAAFPEMESILEKCIKFADKYLANLQKGDVMLQFYSERLEEKLNEAVS